MYFLASFLYKYQCYSPQDDNLSFQSKVREFRTFNFRFFSPLPVDKDTLAEVGGSRYYRFSYVLHGGLWGLSKASEGGHIGPSMFGPCTVALEGLAFSGGLVVKLTQEGFLNPFANVSLGSQELLDVPLIQVKSQGQSGSRVSTMSLW